MLHVSDWRSRAQGDTRTRTSFIKLLARMIWPVLVCTSPGSAGHTQVPQADLPAVTVDDVLKIEGFGDARFSPDGRWLFYNQIPPYDQLKDYSYGLYGYIQSGHRIHYVDLRSGHGAALHPGFNPDASSYLLGFSPDSRHVVALEYSLGNFQITACRTGVDDCVRFPVMPDVLDRYFASAPWNERLVWASANSFILPVRDEFQPGSELRARGVVGRYLTQQWYRAWTGSGATASQIVSTGRDRTPDRADGALIEFNLDTGAARLLAEGRFAGARLSPDRLELAAARASVRNRPAPGTSSDPDLTHSPFDRSYRLSLIDLSGTVREVAVPHSVDPNSIEWSPDGRRLVAYGWDESESAAEGRLYLIDRADLSASVYPLPGLVLANSRLNETLPITVGPARLLMFSDGIAVFARPAAGGRYDWYHVGPGGDTRLLSGELAHVSGYPLNADDRSAAVLARDGVYRVANDSPAMRLTPVREGEYASLSYRPNPEHSWSYAFRMTSDLHREDWQSTFAAVVRTGENTGDAEVVFLSGAGQEYPGPPLAVPFEGARIIAASAAAGAAVLTAKDGAATRMVLVRRSGPALELARINQHLNHIAHPATEKISYEVADPEHSDQRYNVTACLTLPKGYQPDRQYPLIVEAYPVGTPGSCNTLGDAAKPALSLRDLWVSRGFIHVRPALPLDLARTKEGPLGGIGAILEQTADEIVRQGYADPDRIVLYGFSQGGVSALQAATQSDRFSAVISMNGWADYFSHYFGPRGLMRYFHLDQNGGDNRWRYECLEEGSNHHCPFGFGTTPLLAPDEYAVASPVALAAYIRSPVMLIHSDLDYFDMSQYDAMFGALYRAGKEAVYVRYWGEGHGPSSPANMRDLWERIDGFLESTGVVDTRGKGTTESPGRAASPNSDAP